jgi:hypothetical protein
MVARYLSAFHTMAAPMAGQSSVRAQVGAGAAINLPRGGS